MKNRMWFLVGAIVIVLILATLFISWQLPFNVVNTTETNSQTQDTFTMKAKCASYREDIEQRMAATLWTRYAVDEIFYSPIENSCLYAVNAYQERNSYSAYIIWDYLSGEMLFYRDTTLTNGQDIASIYQNAKEYLKGEAELQYSQNEWELSE